MAWDSTNQIMTAPLSIQDISDAIGYVSDDLGTLVTQGVSQVLIKKWARYKPINTAQVGFVTEAQRKAANFGLSAVEQTAPATAAAAGWLYETPSHYYRMADFVQVSDDGVLSTTYGYTTDNVPPCRGFHSDVDQSSQLSLYEYWKGSSSQSTITVDAIIAGSNTAIGLAEMGGLADWYVCVVVKVVKNNTTTYYMITSPATIGSGSTGTSAAWQDILIPQNDTIFSTAATYDAYMILANKCKTSWYNVASDSSLRFLPMPADITICTFSWQVNVGNFSAWVGSAYRLMDGTIAERRIVHYALFGRNSTGSPIYYSSGYGRSLTIELVDTVSGTTLATDTYTGTLPVTGNSSVQLTGSGATGELGSVSVPSAETGTLIVRVTGTYNGVTEYSSYTPVTDGLLPPEPDR